MHMADALLAPGVAGVMYACSAVAAGRSVRKLNQQPDDKAVPVMGVMGAFVFAAQMINFTIPGTGSSGHLCGGMLLAAIVGPYAAFLTMIGVLLIQCLLFADGGLMALGANIWNMAFYGCFVGGLIWRLYPQGAEPCENYRRIADRLHPFAAAGGVLGIRRNAGLRHYGAALWCVFAGHAAHSSRHWRSGRLHYRRCACVFVRGTPQSAVAGRRGHRGEAAPDLTRHAGRAGGRGRGRRRRAFAGVQTCALPIWHLTSPMGWNGRCSV